MNFSKKSEIAEQPAKPEEKKLGSGNGTSRVYQVQARARVGYPSFAIGKQVFDQEWHDVHLSEVQPPAGVPTHRWDIENIGYGVGFPQAETHRLWFICFVDVNVPGHQVDTRIVERRIERRWSAVEVGVVTKWPHWVEGHDIWTPKSAEPAAQ